MSSKNKTIFIVVIVFIIIGVVVYLFTKSGPNDGVVTKTTEQNGLGQLFNNTSSGWLSAIIGGKNKELSTPPPVVDQGMLD